MRQILLRMVGAFSGLVGGVLINAFVRILFGLGVTIIPFEVFLVEIAPGAIIGTIVGAVWPRAFPWVGWLFKWFTVGD